MSKNRKPKTLRLIARSLLVVTALFWTVFALLSNVENSQDPIWFGVANALPWFALLAVVYISFKWEGIGGSMVVLVGLFTIFFFNTLTSWVTFTLITMPILIAGAMLVICSYRASNT